MLLRDKVLALVKSQAAKPAGACFMREATKRQAIARHHRHEVGERSEGRVERQLAKEGKIGRRKLLPGEQSHMPNLPRAVRDGGRYGRVICWPISRQQQRQAARVKRKAARAQPPPPARPMPRPSTPAPQEWVERRRLVVDLDELEAKRAVAHAAAAAALEAIKKRGPP